MRDGLETALGGAGAADGADAPVELSLVGADPADPSVLLLEGPDGTRFRLPAGSRLRAAVRGAGPTTAPVPAASEPLRPRDIQARIRAGETAADVAADAGVPLEQVQRYEGPVLAERAHVADLARSAVVRGGPGRLTLEDAVRTRLQARGADPSAVAWDAWRRDGGWAVQVAFRAAGRDRSAQWSFVPSNRVLEPLDDEARWLTAPSDDPTGRRLAAVRVYDVEAEDARSAEQGSGGGAGGGLGTGPLPSAGAPSVTFEPSRRPDEPAEGLDEAPSAPPAPFAPPAARGPRTLPGAAPTGPSTGRGAGSRAPEEDPEALLADPAALLAGADAGGVAEDTADASDPADTSDPADLASRTLDLLDALRDRRGRRVPLDMGPDGEPWDDEEDDDLLNALLDLPPGSDPDALELQEEVDRARARLRMVTPPRGLQIPGAGHGPEGAEDDDDEPAPAGPRASLGLVPAPPPTEPLQTTPAPAPSATAPAAPAAPTAPTAAGAPRDLPRGADLDGELLRREPATRRERRRAGDAPSTSQPPATGPAPEAPTWDDEPAAPAGRSALAPGGADDPEHDGDDPGEQPAKRRRSVPSWDEIVFGAPRRD